MLQKIPSSGSDAAPGGLPLVDPTRALVGCGFSGTVRWVDPPILGGAWKVHTSLPEEADDERSR